MKPARKLKGNWTVWEFLTNALEKQAFTAGLMGRKQGVSGEQPHAGAFPQCRRKSCRHGKDSLFVAFAVDVEHHALGVLLQIGLQVDPGHFDAAQAAERAQHDGQPRVLVG